MMKRMAIGSGSVAALIVVVIALFTLAECRRGIVTECNYGKIEIGMTVRDAEAILGPGEIEIGMTVRDAEAILGPGDEVAQMYVPETPDGPVISGERFFLWEDRTTARKVWIGVRSGKVCDRWYWEPSL